MHPEYPELVKTALASDAYWCVPVQETVPGSGTGLLADSVALEHHTQLTRDGEIACQISSIADAPGEKLLNHPVTWGERVPDMRLQQMVVAVEDSRDLVSKFSPTYLFYRAVMAAARKRAQKIAEELYPGLEVKEQSFEDGLQAFYEADSHQHSVETAVDYSRTHVAIIRRSLIYMKRSKEGRLLAMPSAIDVHPDLWKITPLTEMPDVGIGSTYSKDRRGGASHVGKIIEARVVEPRHVNWKDQQRPRGVRHKKRASRVSAAPGRLAASRA